MRTEEHLVRCYYCCSPFLLLLPPPYNINKFLMYSCLILLSRVPVQICFHGWSTVQSYNLPTGVQALPRFTSPPPPGIPTEADYVAAYCAARGISPPSPADWAFFMSLSIFRAAAILAGA